MRRGLPTAYRSITEMHRCLWLAVAEGHDTGQAMDVDALCEPCETASMRVRDAVFDDLRARLSVPERREP